MPAKQSTLDNDLKKVFEAAPVAMILLRRDGSFEYVNQPLLKLLGYTAEEIYQHHVVITHPDDRPLSNRIRHQLTENPCYPVVTEKRYLHKSGAVVHGILTILGQADKNGRINRFIAQIVDTTEIKTAGQLLWKQAHYDALTGLPNRVLLKNCLEQAITNANRLGQRMAVLCLDLDNFKDINATLGHAAGDELLVKAAKRLLQSTPGCNTVARVGGDEYTVVIENVSDNQAVDNLSHSILQVLAKPFQLGFSKVYVSCSIGVTYYPDDNLKAEALLKNAELAMYEAKHRGKNNYQHFNRSILEKTENRLWLNQQLHEAVKENHFQLVYQPIVCLQTGHCRHAEALLRWQHPQLGTIYPEKYIAMAEENGSITAIGNRVFKAAISQVKSWRKSIDPAFQISVNTSPIQFRNDPAGLRKWKAQMQDIDLCGDAIIIEVTEGSMMHMNEDVYSTLLQHRDYGIQVAIDDFGTGYSSLTYLQKLDVDYLKIDQSFVSNLSTDAGDLTLCEAIVAMAHKLNLKVIAEGIETEEEAMLLRRAGCDYGQGFFFQKGVAPDEFESHFSNKLIADRPLSS